MRNTINDMGISSYTVYQRVTLHFHLRDITQHFVPDLCSHQQVFILIQWSSIIVKNVLEQDHPVPAKTKKHSLPVFFGLFFFFLLIVL